MNSATTYIFYEGWKEEPKSQWQYCGDPIVPDCNVNQDGYCYAPPFRWTARAYSAKQGAFFVRNSETSESRADGLGVWWDRSIHDTPAPLAADLTIYYAVEMLCDTPKMTLCATRPEALEHMAELDSWECGGGCIGRHSITPMTLAEAKRSSVRWAWWTGEGAEND